MPFNFKANAGRCPRTKPQIYLVCLSCHARVLAQLEWEEEHGWMILESEWDCPCGGEREEE